jgi:hypothetical protein
MHQYFMGLLKRSIAQKEGNITSMTPIKKWLLLGLLLLLAWAFPSEASFYVSYHGPAPATVSIDGEAAFPVDTPSWYSHHTARLRPGIHSLTLRQGGTVAKSWFLYLHVNSTAVEYDYFQNQPGLALDTRWHMGQVLWD